MNIVPKPVKTFTRDDPCTKVDLHNCFVSGDSYRPRAVVEARGEIGVNAIKYLLREGYAVAEERGGVEYWELTENGHEWLRKGLARHLELHPGDASLVVNKPGASPVRRTRTRRPSGG